MLPSVLLAIGLSWAAPCTDPATALDDAERDAVAFYLTDAQGSLLLAAQSFACAPADPELLGRYWRTQAMIWHIQDDPSAERALAAARRDAPDTFPDALGEELRALWAATEPAGGPALPFRVRGARGSDVVRVDGRQVEAPAAPIGLHVIQLERAGSIVGGRVVDVTGPDMDVSFEGSSLAQAPSLAASWPGPPTWTAFGVKDAAGARLSFGADVIPVALQTPAGREIWPDRRRNGKLQGVALGAVALGSWLNYLMAWDAQRGGNLEPGQRFAGALTASGLIGTGLVWEGVLIGKRRAQRRALLEATASLSP